MSILAIMSVYAQQAPVLADAQEAAQRVEYQAKLQQLLNDRAGYVARIVQRWEDAARESGRWDQDYAENLTNALMKLQPENLLAAGEAPSFFEMMRVLATGPRIRSVSPDGLLAGKQADRFAGQPIDPQALGSTSSDLVFTPLTPCRMFDTRNAGGALTAGVTRTFDADGSNFSAQGGNAAGCGVPLGAATAIAITLTVTSPAGAGWLTAWGLGTQPFTSVLNFAAGETVANTTILPIVPGGGNDFSLNSAANAHYIGDVVGYYAAPVATALDCTTVTSAITVAPNNVWTAIDAACPAGRTVTGGGYTTPEGSLGYPGVWLLSQPAGNSWRIWVDNQTGSNRSMQTYAVCCRVPGR